MNITYNSFFKAKKIISSRLGILHHISKLPRLNSDPLLSSYGIWPGNTEPLLGEKFGGRSSGCNFDLYSSFMGTIGETIERYCSAFYNLDEMKLSSYKALNENAVHPKEYALFHEEQYNRENFTLHPFTEDIELYWDQCYDITEGRTSWAPAATIYLPWTIEQKWITVGTSTGLAAHTNWNKALLTALYEILERDSFVLTWWQNLVTPKFVINDDIRRYIDERFPSNYEWHFFDITYDLEIPSVFGICIGEAEYGKFIAVGTATRDTYSEALKKVILEIGQAVGYFRYLLGEKKDWIPSDNFNKIINFEDHSVFYIKRPDLLNIFDIWLKSVPSKSIDFNETDSSSDLDKIKRISSVLKNKGYNILVKDITTPDANQSGFYSLRVIVPQLLQLGGAYPFYPLGGKRLFEVPRELGYISNDYGTLNKYPHPFP
ncbi:MAG: YcaO-like family protein [Prevotella sp.]|jgi:ribosomal protein S12 methylthiotransferase accessory factor|nr:YcaO-like family protein [Prevotella sp.]MDR2005409.1 YcaO-like family protein [Prevotella sp.]